MWNSAIHIGLGPRKNGATQAEVIRLAKTLQRLEGAAYSAMAPESSASETGNDHGFTAALQALAHG
ncbi:MAG: hypothetical protein JWQ72_2902 [Polaromonas sp.]|nr:hypothetical protein [Polaromonas sp.]